MNLDTNRQYLVVGGTGMLAPLCQSLPPQQLIVAARFVSNQSQVNAMQDDVMTKPLDYLNKPSKAAFLKGLSQWTTLKYCVLWIHSNAHDFSRQIIETVSKFDTPPHIIHVFGADVDDSSLRNYAANIDVRYTSVTLGEVDTGFGSRYMTHHEISKSVIDTLNKLRHGYK